MTKKGTSCKIFDIIKIKPISCVLFVGTALKWYRTKCNIQAEIEEMQEEQRSLSSVETVSVWQLLLDQTVRWQVLSVVVINIGMQLSGIDAVRLTCWFKCRADYTACFKIACCTSSFPVIER